LIETATARSTTAANCLAISVRNQRRRRAYFATAFLLLQNTINRKMVGMAMASLMAATRSIHSCVSGKIQTTTVFLSRGNCTRYLIWMWIQ